MQIVVNDGRQHPAPQPEQGHRTMQIIVNGESREVETGVNLAQLLEGLQVGEGRIAIELNGAIVPKTAFPRQLLEHGDRVEIVQAIGGG